ncbi:bacillithiol biosynthesis cysteine-adding enzyme BshC [Flavobacterium amniphilum]|uniref:bacillithiol biosynthesis cysteine-adding enzyme BshC n=1 Tax=Flavobacterium amniphilum TaxID=1834035 RepID=UPI00202AB644|nr:bacillithiol biosynthesis cysteine-adding enzyme BshC [Flavobacterium amniphilum]MCL9805744.1 bacillithiol biosynthesis cysteine-adding enzyme BshC [Flavobacterium amniphilum]MCL9806331.1 bacillithiol biosynthesis cysteine-adding enzyme BshC [Flavobacterium amniphilum]
MPTDCINYQNSGYFSKLIVDYLDRKPELQSLYHRFPDIGNFLSQIEEKKSNFPVENRVVLVESLLQQNKKIVLSEDSLHNIELLKETNTFTITTGHQLNLFTGPLYFIYKIVSTINLSRQLKAKHPDYNFVPVYWMATEDHDFDEINHFTFRNTKIKWNKASSGPVGRLTTDGLDEVYTQFEKELGIGDNAAYLKELFRKAYLEHETLTDATRFIANELFKEEGLVIIDGDDVNLKKLFAPFVKRELTEQLSFQKVSETNEKLKNYDIQVNPREINLFYIEDKLRERIVFEKGEYSVNNTQIKFSESEILTELENHPEKFSPNVILRPLYQEVILPNLCYIGGGGEIAYWLQLRSNFESNNITFPILLVRNSVLIASEKQVQKIDKLELSWGDLFTKQQDLINTKTKELSNLTIDFSEQKAFLRQQFTVLNDIAKKTDPSFTGAVQAQQVKQIKGLENLEKRLLKAEKRILSDQLERISLIQNELFPNQGLQERKQNFSEFYIESGALLISKLLTGLNPLEQKFSILIL